MQIENISQFLDYKNSCPFCNKELSLILRINSDVTTYEYVESPIKQFTINYSETLFPKVSIELESNEIKAEINKDRFNDNRNNIEYCFNIKYYSIRLNSACRSCPKIYSCRSNTMKIKPIKNYKLSNNIVETTIIETTYDKNIKLTEEFAIIDGDSGYCTHFIYDPFEEKSIISWGKNAKDANGYKQYKIDKEIHLDGLKYNFNDPEKILKKAINLTALK